MKKIFLFFIVFLINLFSNYVWFGFDFEKYKDTQVYVVDEVWVLNSDEINSLDEKIKNIKQKTTAEWFVLIINSLDWQEVASVGHDLFSKLWVWKSDVDNWFVILISINDRTWNITTWYWLESTLPDLLVNRIWTKNFAAFRNWKYYDWIFWTLSDINGILENNPEIISSYKTKEDTFGWPYWMRLPFWNYVSNWIAYLLYFLYSFQFLIAIIVWFLIRIFVTKPKMWVQLKLNLIFVLSSFIILFFITFLFEITKVAAILSVFTFIVFVIFVYAEPREWWWYWSGGWWFGWWWGWGSRWWWGFGWWRSWGWGSSWRW